MRPRSRGQTMADALGALNALRSQGSPVAPLPARIRRWRAKSDLDRSTNAWETTFRRLWTSHNTLCGNRCPCQISQALVCVPKRHLL